MNVINIQNQEVIVKSIVESNTLTVIPESENNVNVVQPITTVIEVASPGPVGPTGPAGSIGPQGPSGSVGPIRQPSELRHSFQTPYDYCGTAPDGTLESNTGWSITRITVAANGSTLVQTGTGSWDNRASLIYT
jgi:hypothetical protein